MSSRGILGLVVMLAICALGVPGAARAFTPGEISELLHAGGRVTVDRQFAMSDLRAFAPIGGDRLTVECEGINPEDTMALLKAGARVMVDASFGSVQVLQFCQTGKGRVFVIAKDFTPDSIDAFRRLGAIIIDGTGGASVDDKLRTLAAGYYVAVDHQFSAESVVELANAGGWRVAVICHGFTVPEVQSFVVAGAMVWMDNSFDFGDVVNVCAQARDRGVVIAKGFAFGDLLQVAQHGSHIVVLSQASGLARMANYNLLNGGR